MPVFVIKAKDKLALRAVDAYRRLCKDQGLDDQAREVAAAYNEMSGWRERNPGEIKLPDHPHVPATGDTRPYAPEDLTCRHIERVEDQPDVCAHCGARLEDGLWVGDDGPLPTSDTKPYPGRES